MNRCVNYVAQQQDDDDEYPMCSVGDRGEVLCIKINKFQVVKTSEVYHANVRYVTHE